MAKKAEATSRNSLSLSPDAIADKIWGEFGELEIEDALSELDRLSLDSDLRTEVMVRLTRKSTESFLKRTDEVNSFNAVDLLDAVDEALEAERDEWIGFDWDMTEDEG